MLRLRKILLSNYTYIILLIIFIPIILIRLDINNKSIYNNKTTKVEGIITRYSINNDTVTIYLKSKENIIGEYNNTFNYKLGDKIKVIGEFTKSNNKEYN